MEEKKIPSVIKRINRLFSKFILRNESYANEKLMLKIEPEILMMGEKSNYYKYFFAVENPEKENLYILHKGIMNQRIIYIFSGFFTYELIKRILWNRGYFAYFFFHTRLMSLATLLIALNITNRNFESNLITDQLYAYKNKNVRRELILNKISENYLKEYLINQKKQNPEY